jgi:diguanylate cyclase (GGDEF)-like protein
MKILLIEDDALLADVLVESLTGQRYVLDLAEDGKLGWEYAQNTAYDLILMDVGLPKLDGITLCQKLRAEGCTTPILLMTARDASGDRIRGLDAGADDYVTKPLDFGELQARIRALLRRGNSLQTPVLQLGALCLDPRTCQVTFREQPLPLTPKEYSLLELFMRNPARVFSRGNIIEHLWTYDDPPQEESVKAHIKGLRQKLKAVGAVDWIENVYGIGYRLKESVGEQTDQATESLAENSPSHSSDARWPDSPNENTAPWESQPTELKTLPTPHPALRTPHSKEQQFNQAMEGLWMRYHGLMTERLEVLHKAVAADVDTLAEESQQQAAQAAHKLAGVLGMFGLETGTLIARDIEAILSPLDRLVREQTDQLRSLVYKLDNLIESRLPQKEYATPVQPDVASTARLLLVDPDLKLAADLRALAQSEGMNWEQVNTLEQAELVLQQRSPDLVVLSVDDITPDAEWLALLADLSARTPAVPVLVLASGDALVDRVTVARAGGRGFFTKPVTATELWAMAAQVLQQRRSQTVNLLIVDDDPLFLATLHPMLEPWGIRMTGLEDPTRFWQVLQSVQPDLLILDVDMPQHNGIELCQAVRTDPTWQGLPVLFLTAHRSRTIIQQVFAAGADDYIAKPVVEAELLTRITNRLERNQLLHRYATRDSLTGLPNQSQSSTDLQRLLQHSATSNPCCLGFLSLPHLRQIKIQYGHAIGNQILQRWGSLFQASFRGSEIIGYWGDGEFVVGMPGLTRNEARDRLSEFLTTLRQQVFTAPDQTCFQVPCQVAIVECPTDGNTLQALYQATVSSQQ